MSTLYIFDNILERDKFKRFECENVVEELTKHFKTFPQGAKIYHNEIAIENDVTPEVPEDVEALTKMEGTFYCVVYPQAQAIPYLIVLVLSITAAILLKPKIPQIERDDASNGSNRNSLRSLQNKQRIDGRVPYIFGQCRVVPDLLQQPLRFYRNNYEYEYSFLCLGNGRFTVDEMFKGEHNVSNAENIHCDIFTESSKLLHPAKSFGTLQEYYEFEGHNFKDYYPKQIDVFTGKTLKAYKSPNLKDAFFNYSASNVQQYHDYFVRNASSDIRYFRFKGNAIEIAFGRHGFKKLDEFFSIGDKIVLKVIEQAASTNFAGTLPYAYFNSTGDLIFTSVWNHSGYIESEVLNANPVYNSMPEPVNNFNDGNKHLVTNNLPIKLTNGKYIKLKPNQVLEFDALSYDRVEKVERRHNVIFARTAFASFSIKNPEFEYTTQTVSTNLLKNVVKQFKNLSGDNFATKVYEVEGFEEYKMLLKGANFGSDYIISSKIANKRFEIDINKSSLATSADVNIAQFHRLLVNIVAPNGLYAIDDNGKQHGKEVEVAIKVSDELGNSSEQTVKLTGFSKDRSKVGVSKVVLLAGKTINKIEVRRITEEITARSGVSQDVKIESIYELVPYEKSKLPEANYACYLETIDKQKSVEDSRRINFKVTDYLKTWTGQIYKFLKHKYGANLTSDKIVENTPLLDFELSKRKYKSEVLTLNYASDEPNQSLEQFLQDAGKVCFFRSFRKDSRVQFDVDFGEKVPTMLFNHRNIMPDTFKCTYRFGVENDYEGVKLEYYTHDSLEPKYAKVPEENLTKYKQVKAKGIGSTSQAYVVAWRHWNEMLHNNKFIEFEATPEGNIVTVGNVIVAPNELFKSDIISTGEIVAKNGRILTLSQPVENIGNKTFQIMIQHHDGSIESIPVQHERLNVGDYKVEIVEEPSMELNLDLDAFAKPVYWICEYGKHLYGLYKVVEIEPLEDMKVKISAVEYDERVYVYDREYLTR